MSRHDAKWCPSPLENRHLYYHTANALVLRAKGKRFFLQLPLRKARLIAVNPASFGREQRLAAHHAEIGMPEYEHLFNEGWMDGLDGVG